MVLQCTLICESCYKHVIHDGGIQTTEGWWIFDNEYEKARIREARANVARRRQGPEDYRQETEPVNAACKVVKGNSPKHAETSEQAGVSGNNHIEEDLDEVGWLPADERVLTVFPEIGQERHWVKESYPLEIEELCELLMSRERVRRLRKDMPDPASDSVMPTASDQSAAVEQTPSGGVVGLPTEADSKSIVAQSSDVQTQASELPLEHPSGRLL